MFSLSSLVGHYVWSPPEAVAFMLTVYAAEVVTDLIAVAFAGKLSRWLAFRKVYRFVFSSVFAAALLALTTGAARYCPADGWLPNLAWLPRTIYFLIVSGLILLIVRRAARLGVLNPTIADVLEPRVNLIKNQFKQHEEPFTNGGPGSDQRDPGSPTDRF